MAECVIVGNGSGNSEQLGIYPIGSDSRPIGDVVVPEGVTSLYGYVFRDNTNVTTIQLPQTLSVIAPYSFTNCKNLTNISIPLSVTSIGGYAFQNCVALNCDIILSKFIYKIDNYCFNASSIKTITTLTDGDPEDNQKLTISNYAFKDCSCLSDFTIADTVGSVYVGSNAFENCTSLTDSSVNVILSKITYCGTSAFAGCTNIININTVMIGDSMFKNCTNLQKVSVISVTSSDSGQSVFSGCTSLQTVIFEEEAKNKIKAIETSFCDGCTSLLSFIVPDNVIKINNYAFRKCTSMKYLYLPSTITTLTANAINTCTALEDIELGQDWNLSVNFSFTTNLTIDSIVAMFNNLKDLTGDTAKTLTLGATNILKTTEEQRAIAINKNWTLA